MTDRLRDVSHTPPNDGRNWVQRRYQRGPDAVADGGQESGSESENGFEPERLDGADDGAPREEPAEDASTMEDVDHTPPDGEGVNHVYRRGTRRE